jgi:hypothetical protein
LTCSQVVNIFNRYTHHTHLHLCEVNFISNPLQNLQQYGCQTGNKLKKKSRDLNRNSSQNKNETMFGSGCENCPEFGVLGGVIFKLDIL